MDGEGLISASLGITWIAEIHNFSLAIYEIGTFFMTY